MSSKQRIMIVGAGFSGTLSAIRLLQFASTPSEICLLERDEGLKYGGIAYGTVSTTWDHMLNIQAGRITLWRERPEDFLEWANKEADRCAWPDKWRYREFGLSCVVPRRVYRQYLKERLERAVKEAHPDVEFKEICGEVVDLQPASSGFVVHYLSTDGGDGIAKSLWSDYVLLATGHLNPIRKQFYDAVDASDRIVLDPYARSAQALFQKISKDEKILIVGTALSAFDAIVSLHHHGHDGQILMASRSGYMHNTYPDDHQHDILSVRRPPFLDSQKLCCDTVENGILSEFSYLKAMLLKDGVSEEVVAERILKAWEPYVVELIDRMDTKDLQALLEKYKSLIVTSRTCTVREISGVITRKMRSYQGAPKKISVVASGIQDIRLAAEDKKAYVSFADSPDVVTVDRVINCLGYCADYSSARHPLWRAMVAEKKLAQAHQKTGKGIEVGAHGEVVVNGKAIPRLFCVGAMRQGDEMARRGRTGAFVFSIGTIRNQCFDTTMEMIRQAEGEHALVLDGMSPTTHHCMKMIASWLIERITPDTSPEEREQIRKLINGQQGESLKQHYGHLLRTHNYRDRLLFCASNTRHAERAFEESLASLSLNPKVKHSVMDTYFYLVKKHAIHEMCDIAKLALWEAPEYVSQVRNSSTAMTATA